MSSLLIAATVLAASGSAIPECRWADPGRDRYTGTVAAAVDRYGDIPAPVRAVLKERMQAHRYDDIATIDRQRIAGRHDYDGALRDMHFGTGRVCATVDRSAWAAKQQERGLVYCEEGHCLIVPTVCGNVSRVTRLGGGAAAGGGTAGSGVNGVGGSSEGAAGAPALGPLAAVPEAESPSGGSSTVPLAELVFPDFVLPPVVDSGLPQLALAPLTGPSWVDAPWTPSSMSVPLSGGASGGVLSPVPEPPPWALALAGAALLAFWRRRPRG